MIIIYVIPKADAAYLLPQRVASLDEGYITPFRVEGFIYRIPG